VTQHVISNRHQKFALNDANFAPLDCILARVRRKTKEETAAARGQMLAARRYLCGRVQPSDDILEINSDSEHSTSIIAPSSPDIEMT
jgi:hypothetical protein